MITGVMSSNQRVNPFATTYTVQPGTVTTVAGQSNSYTDGSVVVFRHISDADIMTANDVNGPYTDVQTTGFDPAGWVKYVNNRWFFRNSAVATFGTMSPITGTITTISKDVRDIIWHGPSSSYLAVGDDGLGNGLYTTSTNGTTWTDRTDVFTEARANCIAFDGTRTTVVGNDNRVVTSTSTTVPFTWSNVTTGFSATDDPKWVKYFPEKNTWIITNDNTDLISYSTNGTTFFTVDLGFSTGSIGQINIAWLPTMNRWLAVTQGSAASTGRGRYVGISSTDSITSTFIKIVDDSYVDFLQNPNNSSNILHNFKNRYLFVATNNNRLIYTRAG